MTKDKKEVDVTKIQKETGATKATYGCCVVIRPRSCWHRKGLLHCTTLYIAQHLDTPHIINAEFPHTTAPAAGKIWLSDFHNQDFLLHFFQNSFPFLLLYFRVWIQGNFKWRGKLKSFLTLPYKPQKKFEFQILTVRIWACVFCLPFFVFFLPFSSSRRKIHDFSGLRRVQWHASCFGGGREHCSELILSWVTFVFVCLFWK